MAPFAWGGPSKVELATVSLPWGNISADVSLTPPSAESRKGEGQVCNTIRETPKTSSYAPHWVITASVERPCGPFPRAISERLPSKQSSSARIIKTIRGPVTAIGQAQCWCIRHTFCNQGLNQSFAHPNKTFILTRSPGCNHQTKTWENHNLSEQT